MKEFTRIRWHQAHRHAHRKLLKCTDHLRIPTPDGISLSATQGQRWADQEPLCTATGLLLSNSWIREVLLLTYRALPAQRKALRKCL